MDNNAIAEQFSLLSKLLDIHGENSFRAKSYATAAYSIEQLPSSLMTTERSAIAGLRGIGDSTARKIEEILDSGRMKALEELMAKTPPGVLEMMQVKGLGPKKISTIWKVMGIESVGELLYACQENRLLLYKGFGAKTQQNVREAIEFLLRQQDRFLYAELGPQVADISRRLQERWPSRRSEVTGEFRRQCTAMDSIAFVTTIPLKELESILPGMGFPAEFKASEGLLELQQSEVARVVFHAATSADFGSKLFQTTGAPAFLEAWRSRGLPESAAAEEVDLFTAGGVREIPACLRENADIIARALEGPLPKLIRPEDIRGIIHTHSNWSDGSHTIEEMAAGCIEQGYEYLVISDHSRSAQYAGGLSMERIAEQRVAIDALNNKLAPFRIFKSIECDILGDGSLDYPDEILETFDLVIASVHSNLKMSEEKAMSRLLRAIEHPCTTILGHPTGRLLLSRPGYPVDHGRIIEACAAHHVVVEINAHPRRLDLDWSWIPLAMEKGVRLSINPDAHAIEGFKDVGFGVLAAQKGGLTADFNLSSLSLVDFTEFLQQNRAAKRG